MQDDTQSAELFKSHLKSRTLKHLSFFKLVTCILKRVLLHALEFPGLFIYSFITYIVGGALFCGILAGAVFEFPLMDFAALKRSPPNLPAPQTAGKWAAAAAVKAGRKGKQVNSDVWKRAAEFQHCLRPLHAHNSVWKAFVSCCKPLCSEEDLS